MQGKDNLELTNRQTKLDLRKRLEENIFRLHDKVETPDPFIKVGECMISTKQYITTLTGASKAGKSGVFSAIMAGSMLDPYNHLDTLGLSVKKNYEEKGFLHIDTEQSHYNHDKSMRSVIKRAGVTDLPEWFYSFRLRRFTVAERKESLELLLKELKRKHGGIHAILIDGIGDFLENGPNDEKESNEAVAYLERIAIEYDCPIITVLHLNPGRESEKSRGHLGSQLERKSESVLQLKKDDKGISTLEAKLLRNGSFFSPISFIYSEEVNMHLQCDSSPTQDKSIQERKAIEKLANQVLDDNTRLKYSDLVKAIQEAEACGDRTAKTRISKMLHYGFITYDDPINNRGLIKMVQNSETLDVPF